MNHYGTQALAHWHRYLPDRLEQIPDPESFFTELGETAAEQIDQLADSLAQTAPAAGGYMEELARLETARKTAEMQVIREMILIDPQNREVIAQLLG